MHAIVFPVAAGVTFFVNFFTFMIFNHCSGRQDVLVKYLEFDNNCKQHPLLPGF